MYYLKGHPFGAIRQNWLLTNFNAFYQNPFKFQNAPSGESCQQVYEDKSDFWHGQVPPNYAVNIIEVENGKSHLIGDDILYYDRNLNVNPYHPIG